MIAFLMGHTVDVVRHGEVGRDRLNDPVLAEVSRVTTRARLEQSTTDEDSTEAVTVDRWRAFFPAGTNVQSGDTVIESGRTFTVEGSAAREFVPGFSGADHVAATLRLVSAVA